MFVVPLPPPTLPQQQTDGRDNTLGYKPIREIIEQKTTIWKETRRHWHKKRNSDGKIIASVNHHGTPKILSFKSLVEPATIVGFGISIGLGAINISRQNRIAYTYAKSPIQIHPNLYVHRTPPPTNKRMGVTII